MIFFFSRKGLSNTSFKKLARRCIEEACAFVEEWVSKKAGFVAPAACTLFDWSFNWNNQNTQLGLISPNFRSPRSWNLHLSQLSRVLWQSVEKYRHCYKVIHVILKLASKLCQMNHSPEVRWDESQPYWLER